eukprot:GILK01009748.1.p1 GENE.GILK01009748.1~~GILK01009748.1.p1  ORF type:complete len:1463 (+),score=312.38 GILK01009748.1:308-4390(+)
MAKLAEVRRRQRQKFDERRKEARSQQVRMFRKYREGELPDIEIEHKDLLLPLEALSNRDAGIASELFVTVAHAIYLATEEDAVKKQIQRGLKSLLNSSEGQAPATVACFHRLALKLCREDVAAVPSAEVIAKTGLRSLSFQSAILLLEEMLLRANASEPPLKRARGAGSAGRGKARVPVGDGVDEAHTAAVWKELGALYQAMGDTDVVQGVSRHLAYDQRLKEALDATLRNDYEQALRLYEELGDQNSQEENDEAQADRVMRRRECWSKLQRWDAMAEDLGLQGMDPSPEELLPTSPEMWQYLLRTGCKVAEARRTVSDLLDQWVSIHPSLRAMLEDKHGYELAVLAVSQSDLDRAKYYVDCGVKGFLKRWAGLPKLSASARHMLLQDVPRLFELQESLQLFVTDPNQVLARTSETVAAWQARPASAQHDSIEIWDDIVHSRMLCLDTLQNRFAVVFPQGNSVTDEDARALLYNQAAIGSRKQGLLSVADMYLRSALRARGQGRFDLTFFRSVIKLKVQQALIARDSDQLNRVLQVVESKKNEPEVAAGGVRRADFLLLYGTSAWKGLQLALDMATELNQPVNYSVVSNLVSRMHVSLSESEQSLVSSHDESTSIRISLDRKVHTKLGLYYDRMLRDVEDARYGHEWETNLKKVGLDRATLANAVTKHMLHAIKHGSGKARYRFPRLLELLHNYPQATHKEFSVAVAAVPSWMFITWISQLIASLDQVEGDLVLPILLRLARDFPQALYFPFNVSFEDLSAASRTRVQQLVVELKNELFEQFIEALECLIHPEQRVRYWIDQIKPLISSDRTANMNQINAYAAKLMQDCFTVQRPTIGTKIGTYNRKFAKDYEKRAIPAFGPNGELISSMDAKAFAAACEGVLKAFPPQLSMGHDKLSSFSEWLADFNQSSNPLQYIELPGQYSGNENPEIDQHVRLVSVDPSILILGSIRRPKRIKVHGNDEKDYYLLVKGGEDLRLDQRIQQLFSVTNEIFHTDAATAARQLDIKTFQVVPMNKRLGVIEWVQNTVPLKEMIEEEATKRVNKKTSLHTNEAAAARQAWLGKQGKVTGDPGQLYSRVLQAKSQDVISAFKEQEALVPWDLLRSGVLSLASSPEAFLSLRTTFARSLSSFSSVAYVLGIGDRHLENFLLDTTDGGLLGIDFGVAFGSGLALRVPELMPFRLTRQMINLLAPLGTDCLLKPGMVHSLNALRAHKELLLDCCDVFIKEPLLDWVKAAKSRQTAPASGGSNSSKQTEGSSSSDSAVAADVSWYPREKIDIVRRKLEGTNPAQIVLAELQTTSHARQPYAKQVKDIILGDPDRNVRASLPQGRLSVVQQVEALIDMAADPNILGRSWFGWASWV